MDSKFKAAEQKTNFGTKFLSLILSVMLTLSLTLFAVAPVDAVSTEHPFISGQQIYLDATAVESWWTNYQGTTYYPYMYFFNDTVSPSIKCWVPMTRVENAEGLILTGNVPSDGNTYYGLIFTRQSQNSGGWEYNRTHQTVDITWDGESNCYTLYQSSCNSQSNLFGTWNNFVPSVLESPGRYTIKTEFSGAVITAKADSKKAGTADAGDNVTVTVELKDGYFLDTVAVTGKSKTPYDITRIAYNTFTFQMPEENVIINAVCTFDKSQAFKGDVLWVDTQPSITDSPIGIVKWTSDTYTLYLPSGVSNLRVYYGSGSLTIDGNIVEQGQTYSFIDGQTYTVNGHTMKVMQSDSASVYLQTPKNLQIGPVENVSNDEMARIYKETTKQTNGSFMSVDKNGNIVDQPQVLAQIKGRGNSSWEASCRYYGKYAYNIKLDKKTDILNMGAVKAKSFCLLANNVDESSLRNIETYQAAALAGLGFVPHYEVADVYNNGEYLGSYLITEKVDVGTNKLVQGETVEDYHNDTNATGNKIRSTYLDCAFQYVDTGAIDEGVDYTQKAYLLEFDLMERAKMENCWFQTPQGQYIAVKAPEDLNEEEMRFIIGKWIEAEYAVYNGYYNEWNNLMDLNSFADVYLIQEFTKNLDSCATSYYVYYDGGSQERPKWKAMPIWDYDWALGGYRYTKQINTGTESNNYPSNPQGWFSRYKCLVVNDSNQSGWNFQAKLCQNTNFWNDYVVTAWNSHIYSALKDIFTLKIDTDYNSHSKSFAMNEERYHFIYRDLLTSWGSVDTGSTPYAAYCYLKGWANARLDWMHERLQVPFSGVSLSTDKTIAAVGDTITLTAVPYPSYTEGLTYNFTVNGVPITQTTNNSVTFSIENEEPLYFGVSAGGNNGDIEVIVLHKVDAVTPTCIKDGNIEYYTDGLRYFTRNKKGIYNLVWEEETVVPMTGQHSYGKPKWYWSEQYDSAEAAFICDVCGDTHKETATVTTELDEENNIVYTASVQFNDTEYVNSVQIRTVIFDTNGGTNISSQTVISGEKTLPPADPTREGYNFDGWYLGDTAYDFDTPVISNITLTAHWATPITYTLVPEVVPTCVKDGHIEYYAGSDGKIYLFENGIYSETTENDVKINATGHTYSEPVWNWSDDYSTANALFQCMGCMEQQTLNATVTSETTEPTYDADGQTVYTASVVMYGYTYTNTKSVTIPKMEHETTDWKYSVNDNNTVTITKYLGSGGNVTIPDTIDEMSVTAIGSQVFYNKYLTSIYIPDSITSIGGYAFACTGLTNITIPDSVTSINGFAFWSCKQLTSVTLPKHLTSISVHLFDSCTNLMSVNIPENVTSIGTAAFYNCTNLKSINIPNSVASINDAAFASTGLTSVTIPESVTFIKDTAFWFCTSLSNIDVNENNTVYSSDNGVLLNKDKTILISCPQGKQGLYIVPNYVTSIDFYAFNGCTGLTGIIIPESVNSIDDRAFNNCTNLTIYGKTGSYAEQYAVKSNIPFAVYSQVVINSVDINGITTSQTVYAETFTADEFIVPANPYLDGYIFRHWTVNGTVYENSDDVKNAVCTIVSNKTAETIEIKTVYEQNQTTYTVNVDVGGAFSDNSTVKEFHVSDIVTVIADKQAPDQAFTCWKRGEKIVSYDKTYSFFMPDENITLTAIYQGGTEEKGITFLENVKIDQSNRKLSFISVCGVPEKCKMQRAGLIADTDISKVSSFETARFQRLSNKVTENTKNLKYTWTVGGVKDDTVLYVRSYLVYEDSNGNSKELFGDVVEASLDLCRTIIEDEVVN